MIEIIFNERIAIMSKEEIYKKFVDSKLYDFIKSGMTGEPRIVIMDWLREEVDLASQSDYGYMMDYIANRI